MHAHSLMPALGPDLARARQNDLLAAAEHRRAARLLATAPRGPHPDSGSTGSRMPLRPVRLTSRPAG